ncbi:MAG: DUF4178 domain-containing protein [Bacteroidia bacterium]
MENPPLINCPVCSEKLSISGKFQTRALVCSSCKNYLVYDEHLVLKKEKTFDVVPNVVLPIGTKGILFGIEYIVRGIIRKKESGSHKYFWTEYILFNPENGYATLSEFNGHWNLLKQVDQYPRALSKNVRQFTFEGNHYYVYNKYCAKIEQAQGEFHYNILQDEDDKIKEFISPPFILIEESSYDEVKWFKGEYCSPGDVKSAFKIDNVPEREGVGATQTMKIGIRSEILISSGIAFALLLFAVQVIIATFAKNESVFTKTFYDSEMTKEKLIKSSSFDLKGGTSAAEIFVFSPLSNNWLDVDIELINEQTGERFEAIKSLEFYSGVDDGMSWTEGDQKESVVLSAVPDGRYYMLIYPDWGTYASGLPNPSFTVEVRRDVAIWSNLLWTILLVSIYPIVIYFLEKNFESRRWMESDYVHY